MCLQGPHRDRWGDTVMKIQLLLVAVLGALLAGCHSDKANTVQQAAMPEKVIADGSLMTPGTPQITPVPKTVAVTTLPVEWNMWWGENGRHWAVYVDGVKVRSGDLPLKSPQAQEGKVSVELDNPGTHEIKVALCNDNGCTESKPLSVTVVMPS